MEKRRIERTWIQGEKPKPDGLKDFAFQGEALADVFIIDGVTTDGAAVEITGTITALWLGENNVTITMNGSIDDDKAIVTIDDACYGYPGKFIFSVFATNDTQTQCIYCGIGTILKTQSESVAYPSDTIPNVLDLIDDINEVIADIPQDYADLTAHFPITGEFVLGDTSVTEAQLAILSNGVASVSDTQTYLGL